MDARFKVPFNMLVCGPSQSGKSHWVGHLLFYADALLEVPPKKVVWYTPHGDVPPFVDAEVRTDLPWDTDDDGAVDADLIVLDDFAHETSNSKQLTEYITQVSHHKRVSIVILSQNLFWSGKETRTQSLNMHYIVLMSQSRDQQQIRTLARQITHGDPDYKHFLRAYADATGSRPFSYLLVSMHPRDDRCLLLRETIFPEESPSTGVYVREKYKYKSGQASAKNHNAS